MSAQISVDHLIASYRAECIEPATPALQALTERMIAPHVDEIIRDMLELRVNTDRHFARRAAEGAVKGDEGLTADPSKYPLSFCLEITRHMLAQIARGPIPAHMTGWQALHDFVKAGGMIKRIWGALRGGYFQNAVQVGTYYLDVANDTVDPKKIKVEMLPIAQSNFNNLGSFFEFAGVARHYWKSLIIPNRYFPNLAPFFPAILFDKDGSIRFESRNTYLFPMNLHKKFQPAYDYVMDDNVSFMLLEPLLARLQRHAARDARMARRDHLMWFCVGADDYMQARFEMLRKLQKPALARAVRNVLTADTGFDPNFDRVADPATDMPERRSEER